MKSVLGFNFGFFRGFKGKRSNPQEVSTAQAESNQKSQKFSNDGSFLENFKKQNQKFSNDGSFLEQFKKMKEEPKIEKEVKSEPEPSKQQNDWYKAALARAKQIAHTMTTSPTEIKTEPEAQPQLPKGTKIKIFWNFVILSWF